MKKTTLLITTYNRPAYLKRCLDSVRRAEIKDVLIVDDHSTDAETLRILRESEYEIIWKHDKRLGICDSLIFGIDWAFAYKADIVINLDADAIIRNDYMERMIELHEAFPDDIITGFHSTTKNKDGSERHEIIEQGFENNVSFCRKKSVGGINMLWTRSNWDKMRPIIEHCAKHGGNWDHKVSLATNGIICSVPSLVQHIGLQSAMGHMHDAPDIADDFKMLSLPNVTLVCVDDNAARAKDTLDKCQKDIQFGCIKLIAPFPKLGSKEAYSKFIINELHDYIETDFVLIVQHDGYIKNPEAWSPEFTEYDYIGAPWWYKDGMNVGNGGFSLRSKKLLQTTAQLSKQWQTTHPEDHIICRTYRKQLEMHGIKFAPESVAVRFSFEGYNQSGTWSGQFGFHGARAMRTPPNPKMQGFIINQFLGLGDILYLVPLIRHWMALGHDVIWPIADEYFDIRRNFPDIQFVRKRDWPGVKYNMPLEHPHRWQYGVYVVKPLRWNKSLRYQDAMSTKYTMYGCTPEMWRGLYWERNEERERQLAELVQAESEYALIFQEFGNITDGGASAKVLPVVTERKKVYVSKMKGFTLLDWSYIIENAKEIHAVSSSCIYLFEMLQLRAESVHLYSRKAGKIDFDMVRPILTKDYVYHV